MSPGPLSPGPTRAPLGSAPPGEGQRGRIAAPGASHAPPAGRGYKERRGRRRRSAAARSDGAAGTGQRERNGVAGEWLVPRWFPPVTSLSGPPLPPGAETRELIALFAPPRRWEPGPGWDPGSSPGRPRPAEDLLLEWRGVAVRVGTRLLSHPGCEHPGGSWRYGAAGLRARVVTRGVKKSEDFEPLWGRTG